MALTREQILARQFDLPREPVHVPDLGGEVYVRVLPLSRLTQLVADERAAGAGREHEGMVRLVIACACDADGTPLFADGDAEALANLPLSAVKAVTDAAMRLNKLDGGQFEAGRKN